MRRSTMFSGSVLALGIVSVLALASVGQAAEKKQAVPSAAGKHEIRETVSFTFQKIEAAQFNPKELSVDKSVPWKQGDSSATQVRKAVDRVLKRGAQPTANDVALEKVTLVHEAIERR